MLLTDTKVHTSVWKAVLLALAVMALLGVAERFWTRAKLQDAGIGPDGANITFENAISETVETINQRLNDQEGQINQRLYDLEKVVFKDGPPSGDGQ